MLTSIFNPFTCEQVLKSVIFNLKKMNYGKHDQLQHQLSAIEPKGILFGM
jgi:hypothetical protein